MLRPCRPERRERLRISVFPDLCKSTSYATIHPQAPTADKLTALGDCWHLQVYEHCALSLSVTSWPRLLVRLYVALPQTVKGG